MIKLKTNEPIDIRLMELGFGATLITVDRVTYAVLQNTEINEVNKTKLVAWINETYYNNDFKSSHYTAPSLDDNYFSKGGL